MDKRLRPMTVSDLIKCLTTLKRSKQITDDTTLWLSSDEEGNDFSPLAVDTTISIGVERDKTRITFYPYSDSSR